MRALGLPDATGGARVFFPVPVLIPVNETGGRRRSAGGVRTGKRN